MKTVKGITHRAFKGWLRKQPASRTFRYLDTKGCVNASFLRETGLVPEANCGTTHYIVGRARAQYPFPRFMCLIDDAAVKCCAHFTTADFRAEYAKKRYQPKKGNE